MTTKQFVHEAVNEALELESAWQNCGRRNALLCYTTRLFGTLSWESRLKSLPFSARADSRNP